MKVNTTKIPQVQNLQSTNGNDIPNQFEIVGVTVKVGNKNMVGTMFQSYTSFIAFRSGDTIVLDAEKHDFSNVTTKYRNIFLNRTTAQVDQMIENGSIKLANLN